VAKREKGREEQRLLLVRCMKSKKKNYEEEVKQYGTKRKKSKPGRAKGRVPDSKRKKGKDVAPVQQRPEEWA